jgi:hypothetical protein
MTDHPENEATIVSRFQAGEGIWFSRLSDDTVVIEVWNNPDHETLRKPPDKRLELDAYAWASTVAGLSPHGDTVEAWTKALEFHAGSGRPLEAL